MVDIIFPINVAFGTSVKLAFPEELQQTCGGKDFINAQTVQPLLEFGISRRVLNETEKTLLEAFFNERKGSDNIFLFQDFTDYTATQFGEDNSDDRYDTAFGYNRGSTQGRVIQDSQGKLQLCKSYTITAGTVHRAITKPKDVIVYDSGGNVRVPQPTIDFTNGTITSGGADGDFWAGEFYVPVRFLEKDELNFTQVSECTYQFNNRFIEVKQNSSRLPHTIVLNYNEYFSLFFTYGSEAKKVLNTDIIKFSNQFESREQQYSEAQEYFTDTDRKLLNYKDIQYLISAYRVNLGSTGVFRFYRFDAPIGDTIRTSFFRPIEYAIDAEEDDLEYLLFSISNLSLKKTANLGDDIQTGLMRTLYCICWEIERNDGVFVRYTNHDEDVLYNGNEYTAFRGLEGSAYVQDADLEVKNSEFKGVLDIYVTEEDIVGGRYDDARVRIYLVDWVGQNLAAELPGGYIGEKTTYYTQEGLRKYKLEVISSARKVKQQVSVLTSFACRHEFLSQGEDACNLAFTVASNPDATATNVRVDTTITNVPTINTIETNTVGDWTTYTKGVIQFVTGKLAGKEYPIESGSGNTLQVGFSFLVLPEIGDQILVTKPCNKVLTGDCTFYGNEVNFGGQTRIPGNKRIASNPRG